MSVGQGYQELKRTVLQYINSTTGGSDPMQLDMMQATGGGEGSGGGLDALARRRGPDGGCWICGGSHYANECPRNKDPKGGRAKVEETKVERETVEEEDPKEVKAMNQEEERDTERQKGTKEEEKVDQKADAGYAEEIITKRIAQGMEEEGR